MILVIPIFKPVNRRLDLKFPGIVAQTGLEDAMLLQMAGLMCIIFMLLISPSIADESAYTNSVVLDQDGILGEIKFDDFLQLDIFGQQCPHNLTNPDHGQVTVDTSVATYSCCDGYGREGCKTRSCGTDGTWSGEQPVCKPCSMQSPESQTVTINSVVNFTCIQQQCLTSILLNNTPTVDICLFGDSGCKCNIKHNSSGVILTLCASKECNGSLIECSRNGEVYEPARLWIQGILASPFNLSFNSTHLIWEPPFTLDITNAVDITNYTVYIRFVSSNKACEINVTKPVFKFSEIPNECRLNPQSEQDMHVFRVSAWNAAGEGNQSQAVTIQVSVVVPVTTATRPPVASSQTPTLPTETSSTQLPSAPTIHPNVTTTDTFTPGPSPMSPSDDADDGDTTITIVVVIIAVVVVGVLVANLTLIVLLHLDLLSCCLVKRSEVETVSDDNRKEYKTFPRILFLLMVLVITLPFVIYYYCWHKKSRSSKTNVPVHRKNVQTGSASADTRSSPEATEEDTVVDTSRKKLKPEDTQPTYAAPETIPCENPDETSQGEEEHREEYSNETTV